MAPKLPCAKYQYVVTPAGPKILPVEELSCKDEESPADYNAGGYLPVKLNDTFKDGRYRVIRKLGCVFLSIQVPLYANAHRIQSIHHRWGHFSTVWLVKDTQYDTYILLSFRVESTVFFSGPAAIPLLKLSNPRDATPRPPETKSSYSPKCLLFLRHIPAGHTSYLSSTLSFIKAQRHRMFASYSNRSARTC